MEVLSRSGPPGRDHDPGVEDQAEISSMGTPGPDQPYECKLSEELQKKAEVELNEKPEWRARDIQALRAMVKKYPGLKCPTDDMFLLRFLRARKFDYDRALQLIVNYYKKHKEFQDIFEKYKPSAVKHVLDDSITNVLKQHDKDGRRIIVFRPGRWDPDKFPIIDIFRTNLMSMEKLIQDEEIQISGIVLLADLKHLRLSVAKKLDPVLMVKLVSLCQEEETQINGVIMVGDMTNMGWKQAQNMSPTYARKVTSVIQEAFPARFKAIHFFNEPSFFGTVFNIVRPFLKEKLRKRLHFHSGSMESLHEFLSPEILPEEYGGKLGPFNNSEWAETLLASDQEYDEIMKYELEEYAPISAKETADPAGGVAGAFRKLNVD